MLEALLGFTDRLRQAGVPVSTSEAMDACAALDHVRWIERDDFRAALFSTLVKNSSHEETFSTLFDLYFPASGAPETTAEAPSDPEDLARALLRNDPAELDAIAAAAIERLSGWEAGRPVAGILYQQRVEEGLDLPRVNVALQGMLSARGGVGGRGDMALTARLIAEEARARLGIFRAALRRRIRMQLVAERGPEAMADALVRPSLEDMDLLRISSRDMAEMGRVVNMLGRRLAARLAYKHHRGPHGRLDFHKTFRNSLSTGGVPIDPAFDRRTHRPEIVMICDVSGSVAAFSRFAIALLFSLNQHFEKIRSFVFVDTVDEVTHIFQENGLELAAKRVREEADVVWLDGHSDYGHSLQEFARRYDDALSPRATVLLLGDCRSNYRAPAADVLAGVRDRVRKLYLLDPEPRSDWDTDDSIVSTYAPATSGVFECRTIRQLVRFVERIA